MALAGDAGERGYPTLGWVLGLFTFFTSSTVKRAVRRTKLQLGQIHTLFLSCTLQACPRLSRGE